MGTSRDRSQGQIDIRPEAAGDVEEISSVIEAAFSRVEHSAPPVTAGGPPGEVDLVAWLREDEGWLPHLSLVAVWDGRVVGHVVCTRAQVDGAAALGLGPLSVHPEFQGQGVGHALMREVLARAEKAGETLVALVGDPAYYGRFGFVPARELGVSSPDPGYGDAFQARTLGPGDHPRGHFRYAKPFERLG
jgi:putative acetyltransferase